MNFLSATIIALVVVGTNGFSVTMSSIGYLDNLAKGSVQLSSFATTSAPPAPATSWSGSSYAPPASAPATAPPSYSYGAPPPAAPPAPTQYKSGFADAPANNDLHYIKTLGGGSSIKSGRNFSGVSSYFRATASTSYTDNLKGKVMVSSTYSYSAPPPAAAPQQPAWGMPPSPPPAAPTPAPSNKAAVRGFGSYLDNL